MLNYQRVSLAHSIMLNGLVPEIAGYTFLEPRSYGAARGLELAELVLANTADAMVSQCFTARCNDL